jgi:hypothetical protein
LTSSDTLQIVSDYKSIDGKTIDACHSSAAEEVVCIPPGGAGRHAAFYVNYTSSNSQFSQDLGVLTWHLVTGDGPEDIYPSFPQSKKVDPAHGGVVALYINVGLRISPDLVYFGKNEKMYPLGINQELIPDTSMPGRCAICTLKTWSGYTYDTLTWQAGNGDISDPSFKRAGVRRVWVE